MRRKNSNGESAPRIIKNGATFKHYSFLQNGALFISQLPEKERSFLAAGTTSNEALRSECKRWRQHVRLQHKDTAELRIAICRTTKFFCALLGAKASYDDADATRTGEARSRSAHVGKRFFVRYPRQRRR